MHVPQTDVVIRSSDGRELGRATLGPGEYVLGSEAGSDLRVEAESVAPRHARLTIHFDHTLVEDLGGGTAVNGQPVTGSARLWPGQHVQLGTATVELRRQKTLPLPDVSLAPNVAITRELLPEELRRERRYDIGGVIAQGGMGAILRAQEATIERGVAMKVMLDGSSPDALVRFIAEARVTGQLEHPNIVPVHELGVDENDQVFYTMKLVRGVTLKEVLARLAGGDAETRKKHPLGALLTIFQKVCDAVAFAHSRGVIHRDLKPDNIMLGDFGEVLVMDWGLAKIIGGTRSVVSSTSGGNGKDQGPDGAGPSIGHSLLRAMPEVDGATLGGTILGTPQYMSPEQARGEVESLDARADIYALGAILYHLLALRPPVQGRDSAAIVERVARGNLDPLESPRGARPGARIPDSLAAVMRQAMALEKARRYASVAGLQADVAAYQNGFATSAEGAGAWRQFQLLMRRHQVVTAALAVLLLVSVGFVLKVIASEREATRHAGIAAANEKAARQSLVQSEQVSKFLKNVLAQAGVYKSLGRDATMMREILDATAKSIGPELADQPEVQAELRALIGRTYEDLNEYELGVAQAAEAVRLRRELHATDHEALANALLDHASLLESLGRVKEAEAAVRECLAMFQRLRGDDCVEAGKAHALLSWTLTKSGRALEGEASALHAMALWRTSSDKTALNNAPRALAIMYSNTRRGDKAVEVKREELEALKQIHGPEHPNVHNCLDNLGFHLVGIGRFDEAEPYLLESLRQGVKFYQDRDPVADHANACLARIAASRKDWAGQLKYARESMAAAHRVFPKGHRYWREGSSALARVLLEQAERCLDEAWKTHDAAAAANALGFIEELRSSAELEVDAKGATAWLNCLRGRALMLDPATTDEGKTLLARGREALKKNDKPKTEDTRRLKKAEGWP